ncbi:MAG TPA: NYN domain-containing protein [Candidatus Eisenbacteria bacterium]|jgi:predicted RNA-binding protein with PIN domain
MALDRLIVIDGYNLILRSPALRPGPGRSLQEARDRLVNLLSWAIGSGDARFLVVFDGAEGGGGVSGGGRVEVRYSKPPEKADDLIRRLVEERIERVERLTVVTSDLEVARHARAMGADVALGDLFVSNVLIPSRSEGGEDAKPPALSRKEVEEWAEIFRSRRTTGRDAPDDEPAP